MRVAITGATGNIGTATLRRPAPDGHHIVDAGRQGAHCSHRQPAGLPWSDVVETEQRCIPLERARDVCRSD
jgi:uncharacterized protein YbjT (DUF2867 family)